MPVVLSERALGPAFELGLVPRRLETRMSKATVACRSPRAPANGTLAQSATPCDSNVTRESLGMTTARRPPPVPSLGQLRKSAPWLRMFCAAGCGHHRSVALAPFIIRWGANASSDMLRHAARCSNCGRKGATLQHPSWVNSQIGFEPFPSNRTEPRRQPPGQLS